MVLSDFSTVEAKKKKKKRLRSPSWDLFVSWFSDVNEKPFAY